MLLSSPPPTATPFSPISASCEQTNSCSDGCSINKEPYPAKKKQIMMDVQGKERDLGLEKLLLLYPGEKAHMGKGSCFREEARCWLGCSSYHRSYRVFAIEIIRDRCVRYHLKHLVLLNSLQRHGFFFFFFLFLSKKKCVDSQTGNFFISICETLGICACFVALPRIFQSWYCFTVSHGLRGVLHTRRKIIASGRVFLNDNHNSWKQAHLSRQAPMAE